MSKLRSEKHRFVNLVGKKLFSYVKKVLGEQKYPLVYIFGGFRCVY
jgi:hypothetical protein